MTQNPMVPSTDWSQAAQEFAAQTGHQALLCALCVLRGVTTPPTRVVISGGQSLCLDDFYREQQEGLRSV